MNSILKGTTNVQTTATAIAAAYDEDRYNDFLKGVRDRLGVWLASNTYSLFTTDAPDLWALYLDHAPPEQRQFRNCHCCRHFIERFGGLAVISEEGTLYSALWSDHDVPPMYADASRAMKARVERAQVAGVFRSKEAALGTARTGDWTHFAIELPRVMLSNHPLKTASQEMAEKREEYGMLRRSLADFDLLAVRQAVAILSSDALYRSEKCLGVAQWLLALHESLAATKNERVREHFCWRAVAKAPPGYCHVRTGMIGTLLEDVVAGLHIEDIKRKFAEKMNPLQYLRPQAAPSAGNLAQAEAAMTALGAAGALERRFAKLDDVKALWRPEPGVAKVEVKGGLFGHLAPKLASDLPQTSFATPTTMTWAKFSSHILPGAERIECLVPSGRTNFTAMITAKNADAPNMLQWDNPVSHYMYHSGSPAAQWNLSSGTWCPVVAVVLRSWMWDDPVKFKHHGQGVVLVLQGCRDTAYTKSGGMFPEQMRSEYHGIRRTLEAYFAGAVIGGRDEAEACGLALVEGGQWNATVRVLSHGMWTSYKLDRWD